MFGLPVEGAIRRGVEARLAREAAVVAVKQDAERQRVEALVYRIEAYAIHLMGRSDGLAWTDKRRDALTASETARAAARVNLEEMDRAQRTQAALDALAAEMRATLEKATDARLGDAASLFLHTGNNHCRGQHPWAYTVDRHTLRDALHAVAMAPVPKRRKR